MGDGGSVAARFGDEPAARRAYLRAREALLGDAGCELSVYRLLVDGIPVVVVLGDPPPSALGARLGAALAGGVPAGLPGPAVRALGVRRARQRRRAPWVEEHHRPPRPL